MSPPPDPARQPGARCLGARINKVAALLLLGPLLAGCAVVGPRFSPEVATSFAQDPMRRMETEHLVIYYPAHAKERAEEIASRLEACVVQLRAKVISPTPRRKVVTLVTSAEFNNAFVRPQAVGYPLEMVLPLQMGLELFNHFDLGAANIGDVGCHEAVHYVQLEQTDGFWRYANAVFGDLASPNITTEGWFLEGLATWLEANLGHHAGRPHSPLWTAAFAAGIASDGGRVRAGRLNPADREQLPFGGSYLTGSYFVAWLAQTYGEEKLWELIDRQGRSFAFPFGVTLRFRQVYGLTLGGLLQQYQARVQEDLVQRERPEGQQVLAADLGQLARLATAQDGTIAVAFVGLDQPSTLELREADGSLRFRAPLARVMPWRPWVSSHPAGLSGLSFSPDGRSLFLFSEELDHHTGSTYELRELDAHDGSHRRSWKGLRGMGGGLTPDGTGYLFVQMEQGRSELARLDLSTGGIERLTSLQTSDSLGSPAPSPDGSRIVFPRRGAHGFDLWLREGDGRLRRLTHDGRFNYAARWVDNDRVVLLREHQGRAQVFSLQVDSGELQRLTDVPWAALDPAPSRGRLVFLNRQGWQWSLDAVPLGEGEQVPPAPAEVLPEEVEDPAPKVLADGPYRGFDELFIPRLRAPLVLAYPDADGRWQPFLALGAMGFDRLGWHSWGLGLTYDGAVGDPSVALAYGTSLLSPWYLQLSASRSVDLSALNVTTPAGLRVRVGELRTTDLLLRAVASRPLYAKGLSFGFEALRREERAQLDADPSSGTSEQVRLLGPTVAASWFAGESTAYAGVRRGLSLSGSTTFYPRGLGSDFDLADLRGSLGVFLPLPFSSRHTFALSLRGRAVPGPVRGLLRVGGVRSASGWVSGVPQSATASGPGLLLPGLSFVEPARGFDDFALRARAAALLGGRYRYPVPIDRGSTSTLWVFSSLFARQLELETFFEGIHTDVPEQRPLAALGGAARLRLLYASAIPISLVGQVAWRTRADLGWLYVVGLSAD